MPQRDLHVFTCYLEQMKSASTELKVEIQSAIDAIDHLKKKIPALAPSITLPRKSILECTICNKRVIPND
jgi:hypothetical protein